MEITLNSLLQWTVPKIYVFFALQVFWKFFIIFYKIYKPMSSSQTELVELSDPSAETRK